MMRARIYLIGLVLAACGPKTTPATPGGPITATPAPETPMQNTPHPVDPVPAPKAPHERLIAYCQQAIADSRAGYQRLLDSKDVDRTTENTLEKVNSLVLVAENAAYRAGFLSQVHPDKAMRDAGDECGRELTKWFVELSMSRPLFEIVSAVPEAGLDAQAKRFRERTLRDFRRSGVDKDEASQQRLKELADRDTILGQDFSRNIREDVRSIKFDPKQLDGLPADYIAAHPAGADGKVTITTDYPDYLPFRSYATDRDARKQLFIEFQSRGYPKNEAILKELIEIRAEQAKLLGYPSYGEYQMEIRMAKSAKAVQEFLDKVSSAADKRAKRDYKELLAARKKDDKKAKAVEDFERIFYEEKVKKDNYSFDAQSVRPYFEFTQTRDGLLAITSKLYDIQYHKVDDAEVWHPSVTAYDVMRGDKKLGRIYLDLHPRDGKYKHAAQFTIQKGIRGVQLPEGALVCNFPDPADGPALMEHDDVETMFHEFGHLMHHVLGGDQKWSEFSGVANERDFTESPSIMFEEWAWDASTLQLFAKHIDTKEPIPAELVAKMRKARDFGQGVATRRQVFLAKMALDYYTSDPAKVDLDAIEVAAQKKYHLFDHIAGTHMWAGFGHLDGYAAGYYVYIWSDVIAEDLLSEFKKHGLLDEATAHKYRDTILVPGGTKDAADLVADFLGRPYGFTAYQKRLEGK
jgi:thimet oligopeptidase